MGEPRRHIALAGIGLHAKHNHLRLFAEDPTIQLSAVIERRSREEDARAAVAGNAGNTRFIWCPDEASYNDLLPTEVSGSLDRLVRADRLDGLVVATHPRAHAAYLRWAASRGVDVLVDKPVTAHPLVDEQSALDLERVYKDLQSLFEVGSATAAVMTSRRAHPGYCFVKDYATAFAAEHGVPLTGIDSFFGHGYWNMPDELFTRENHSYRDGYGALLHGGYHAIDTACWLLDANEALGCGAAYDEVRVSTRHVGPADFLSQVNEHAYELAFGPTDVGHWMTPDAIAAAAAFGATDVWLLFQRRRSGRAITTGAIYVGESSVCMRAWRDLPTDTYRGNGRVSRERVTLQFAHLLAIEARYRRGFSGSLDAQDGVFSVDIMRNSRLLGGDAVEQHLFAARDTESLCDEGRREIFRRWIARVQTGSELGTHSNAISLLTAAERSIIRDRAGLTPEVLIHVDPAGVHAVDDL
jgi:predicted dehydrogenase